MRVPINNGRYGIFFAREVWCVADVSSVSPSSEEMTERLCENQCLNSGVHINFNDKGFLKSKLAAKYMNTGKLVTAYVNNSVSFHPTSLEF